MIKGNVVYKIKCLYCGNHMEVKYKNDIAGNIKISCFNCGKEFSLYQNPLLRKFNNLKLTIKLKWHKIKKSKWFEESSNFGNKALIILTVICLIYIIIFWISEFRQGRIWYIFRFPL